LQFFEGGRPLPPPREGVRSTNNISIRQVNPLPTAAQEATATAFPEVQFELEGADGISPGTLRGRVAKGGHDACGGTVRIWHSKLYGAVSMDVSVHFDSPEEARRIADFLKQQLEAMVPGLKRVKYHPEQAASDA
jgi:hypothetical protein